MQINLSGSSVIVKNSCWRLIGDKVVVRYVQLVFKRIIAGEIDSPPCELIGPIVADPTLKGKVVNCMAGSNLAWIVREIEIIRLRFVNVIQIVFCTRCISFNEFAHYDIAFNLTGLEHHRDIEYCLADEYMHSFVLYVDFWGREITIRKNGMGESDDRLLLFIEFRGIEYGIYLP